MEEIIITVAKFYAFNMEGQRLYIDKPKEFILNDLNNICSTQRLISITRYSAKILDVEEFVVSEDAVEPTPEKYLSFGKEEDVAKLEVSEGVVEPTPENIGFGKEEKTDT